MKKRNSFTLVLLFVLIVKINAQEIELGIIGGTNLNFVTLRSDYKINDDINVSPKLSYNIGATLRMKRDRKFGLLTFEYFRLINEDNPRLISYNENNETLNTYNKSVVLHNLRVSTLVNINIFGDFFCGLGVAGNFTIDSKLKLDRDIVDYGNKFEATNIRDFTISIPIMVGYEFNKFDIIFLFDKGIMNRLEGNDGFIKEINNVLSLNFNYRFFKLK